MKKFNCQSRQTFAGTMRDTKRRENYFGKTNSRARWTWRRFFQRGNGIARISKALGR